MRSRSWFVEGVLLCCCGFVAATGCGAGTTSSAGPAAGGGSAIDPARSAAWQWTPCGILPPTGVSATAIAYAPLGEELAAAYADGRVLLHSVDPAAPDRTLTAAGPAATAIAFSPDGRCGGRLRLAHRQRGVDEQHPGRRPSPFNHETLSLPDLAPTGAALQVVAEPPSADLASLVISPTGDSFVTWSRRTPVWGCSCRAATEPC